MLAENLQAVNEKICTAVGKRTEDKITGKNVILVAVTKNHPADVITESLACGIKNIGENRVQEAKFKQDEIGQDGTWHLIGHLQTNKVKQAVALFDIIESVDSERLMTAIDAEAGKIGKVQKVLLQLNIAKEEQKTGFSREEYLDILTKLDSFTHISVKGLMVIAPKTENIEDTRPIFAAGYRCYCRLKNMRPEIEYLSMGMSSDYTVAIEEGANIVRVGTALFGQRDYSLNFKKG